MVWDASAESTNECGLRDSTRGDCAKVRCRQAIMLREIYRDLGPMSGIVLSGKEGGRLKNDMLTSTGRRVRSGWLMIEDNYDEDDDIDDGDYDYNDARADNEVL